MAFFESTEGTRAKICGLLRLEDAHFCAQEGADAIGLNFYPRSKRYLAPEVARSWSSDLPSELTRIGVFVNASLDAIRSLLDDGTIHAAQLHGDETPEDCAHLKRNGHRVLKAFGIRDETSLAGLSTFDVDGIVLDAFCPGDYGGSGKTFQWELALAAKERVGTTPIILSGGLHADNVRAAIDRVHPFAVDVASGVEDPPGVKSQTRIRDFLHAARSSP